MSFYTISRDDVYDYLRCPKIVSIKAFNKKYQDIAHSPIQKTGFELYPHIIGKIGEVSTKIALAKNGIERDVLEKTVKINLARMGLILNEELEKILKESLKGLEDIKKYVEDSYGSLEIIGKGESRYSSTPCYGLPDFVAVNTRTSKPILIEVKNTGSINKGDYFQAKFYNTLESTIGVVILEERLENQQNIIAPKVIFSCDSETLIVYPRLGQCVKVTDTIDMSIDFVKKIWEAKQLGFQRKWPHTDCYEKCPHTKFNVQLSEDNMETSKPLPLILAKGMEEKGAELDYRFLRSYLWNKVPLMSLRPKLTMQVKEILVNTFNLDMTEVEKIIDGNITYVNPSEISEHMGNEVELWQKILGNKL